MITNTSKELPELMLAEMVMRGSSNAIERQEATGQRELCNSQMLPVKGGMYARYSTNDILRSWGVVLGDPCTDDELFRPCQLPDGWSIKPTGRSMWSGLLDERGRQRASIFYKAAFYDRKAHIILLGRYRIDAYSLWKREDDFRQACVKDGDSVVFTSSKHPCRYDEYRAVDDATKECADWLIKLMLEDRVTHL